MNDFLILINAWHFLILIKDLLISRDDTNMNKSFLNINKLFLISNKWHDFLILTNDFFKY